jgi:hypothetical protein
VVPGAASVVSGAASVDGVAELESSPLPHDAISIVVAALVTTGEHAHLPHTGSLLADRHHKSGPW